jgi:hypothetical protein
MATAPVLAFRKSKPGVEEFDISTELGDDETLTSPLLAGLEIEIRELFDR